jgi:MarR family transcriptional regulator, organic hydroperoxide resistance regulator
MSREDLLHDVSSSLIRTLRIVDTVRLQIWDSQDITLPQLRILFNVRSHPGIDLRSLASAFKISNSAVSQQVDKLVVRGLISRVDDQEDRRRICLSLTEAGQQATGDISRATRSQLEGALSSLPDDDLGQLRRLLAAVAPPRPDTDP